MSKVWITAVVTREGRGPITQEDIDALGCALQMTASDHGFQLAGTMQLVDSSELEIEPIIEDEP